MSRKARGCEAKFGLRHLSQGAYFVCCSIFWLWTNLSYLYFMKNILKPSTRNHYGVIGHRFLHFRPFLAVVIALKMARYDFDQPHDWKPTTRLKAIHQCSKIWSYSFPTPCISEVMGNQFLQFWPFLWSIFVIKAARYDFGESHDWKPSISAQKRGVIVSQLQVL